MTNLDEIKGRINQASGDLTDDQVQKLKGHIQEAIGKGKESGGNFVENISKEINEMIDKYKQDNEKEN